MNCPKCYTQNEPNATNCRNCGASLTNAAADNKMESTFLLIFVIVVFFTSIAQFLIQKLIPNWYQAPTKYLQGAIWIVQNLSFFLVPLSIRNKTFKIIGFIFITLTVIYWTSTNITFLLQ